MPKVFFLLSTLSGGGGERVASDLLVNLPESLDKNIFLLEDKISYPYKGKLFLAKSKNIFKKAYEFYKLEKKEKPDYIVSFGKIPNLINIFCSENPVLRVDNFYSSSCFGSKGKIYKILVKLFFNKANKIIVISKESAEDLIKNFNVKKEKLEVIYNPLDVAKIKSLAKEPIEEEWKEIFKNPVIINVGQLGNQKNQKDLIDAFKIAKEKVNDIKLVILGKGPFEEKLKSLVKDQELENSIYFLGWQKNPFKFLANSKIFVLSSLWEGLPCSLLEAMACRVPVVSFDCSSGPREILAPNSSHEAKTKNVEFTDYGALVAPGNIRHLGEALVKILQDDVLWAKLSEGSELRAMEFDARDIIKKWDFLKTQKDD